MKFKQVYMFCRGLDAGALSLLLGADNDPQSALVTLRIVKKFERDGFIPGYKVGYSKKYVEAYKEEESLIALAVDEGDVEPDGWYVHKTIEGSFIEEIE